MSPNGSLQKYNPETGKTVVVNNNMPSDVKDPTRKNKVSSSETKKYDLKDEIEWQRRIDQEAANERIIKF
ncbi:hypothetical protein [Xylanibacter oryzae]|uniref:hypothetical protein n=1 Tax=Xylanibacter oryzae TaxID=185293 RepID=UPI0004B66726|nr:hypothetical protein [Xylanibacter oryzae]